MEPQWVLGLVLVVISGTSTAFATVKSSEISITDVSSSSSSNPSPTSSTETSITPSLQSSEPSTPIVTSTSNPSSTSPTGTSTTPLLQSSEPPTPIVTSSTSSPSSTSPTGTSITSSLQTSEPSTPIVSSSTSNASSTSPTGTSITPSLQSPESSTSVVIFTLDNTKRTTTHPAESLSTTGIAINVSTAESTTKLGILTSRATHAISSASTTPLTAAGVTCKNGGYYDGKKCVCKEIFYGRKCEFALNEISESNVTLKIKITIKIDLTFSKKYLDKTSEEYKAFDKRVKKQMTGFYKQKLGKSVEIIIILISEGSIVVEHEILIPSAFQNIPQDTLFYEKQLSSLFDECTNDKLTDPDSFCFNVTQFNVDNNLTDMCSRVLKIPEEFHNYYFGINGTTKLLCVTNCSTENYYSINCNHGQCSVRSDGPQCYCELSDQYWYTGERCKTSVSKAGVIAGVTVGLVVLLIIILILMYFSYRRQYRSDKIKLIEPELSGYVHRSNIANPENSRSWTGSMSSNPTSGFRPSLENVDTGVNVFSRRPKLDNYDSYE